MFLPQAKTQLDLYEAKLAWLVYDKKRQAYMKLKKSLKVLDAELTQKKKSHAQVKKELDKCERVLSELAKDETSIELSLKKASEARNNARREVNFRSILIRESIGSDRY